MKSSKITEVRPFRTRLGGFVEQIFRARRRYRGINWYLTSFGRESNGKPDRDDWVADVPFVGLSVCRYHDKKGFQIPFEEDDNFSFEEAADVQIKLAFESVKISKAEYLRRAKEIEDAIEILQDA